MESSDDGRSPVTDRTISPAQSHLDNGDKDDYDDDGDDDDDDDDDDMCVLTSQFLYKHCSADSPAAATFQSKSISKSE